MSNVERQRTATAEEVGTHGDALNVRLSTRGKDPNVVPVGHTMEVMAMGRMMVIHRVEGEEGEEGEEDTDEKLTTKYALYFLEKLEVGKVQQVIPY